jgi:DNA helicase HerA-like ATPase
LSKETNNILETILKDRFLTCISLNRIFLGEKATRLIAGLIIQQIFLIAQRRSINKKIILIIDEVSLVENESMMSILSEARKFNLSLFLSQQYLTQISPDLLRAILSNIYNYFIFKVSNEDAKILTKNLQVKFPDESLRKEKERGGSEESLKTSLLVNLNQRECIVRIFSQLKFYSCFKAKTMEI